MINKYTAVLTGLWRISWYYLVDCRVSIAEDGLVLGG